MGQAVAAIVYGVPMTEAICTGLRDYIGDWRTEPPIDVETGCVGDFECLGLTIAVQNVPEDDEVELPEGKLADIPMLLQEEIGTAMENWQQIAAWAKSHKVTLGRPSLMLVQIERA